MRKGFTLIELIIVIVIIGVLAAIAAPMMAGNVTKAKKSEAVAVLGAIRTAERLYFAENNKYVTVANTNWADGALSTYIKDVDIAGRYFPAGCYGVSATNTTFTATCTPSASGISESNTITGTVNINETGMIYGYS